MRKKKKKKAEKLLMELTLALCNDLGIVPDNDELNRMVAECSSSAKEELNFDEEED